MESYLEKDEIKWRQCRNNVSVLFLAAKIISFDFKITPSEKF